MLDFFDNHRHNHYRALQIWQILIGKAHNRQLTTYKEVSTLLGYKGSGVLGDPLGHIAFYCNLNNLPALTSIVVNEETGEPGQSIPIPKDKIHTNQANVFQYNWFGIIPPSPTDFKEAWEHFES